MFEIYTLKQLDEAAMLNAKQQVLAIEHEKFYGDPEGDPMDSLKNGRLVMTEDILKSMDDYDVNDVKEIAKLHNYRFDEDGDII